MVILMAVIFLSLCLLSAALTGKEKNKNVINLLNVFSISYLEDVREQICFGLNNIYQARLQSGRRDWNQQLFGILAFNALKLNFTCERFDNIFHWYINDT